MPVFSLVRSAFPLLPLLAGMAECVLQSPARAEEIKTEAETDFEKNIRPILQEHCFDCHADGADKGNVSFDAGSLEELTGRTDLWVHVLRNVRSGLMPPPKKDRLSAEELEKLQAWIKSGALKLDPANPDPGRVTLRRLNRIEYRNTIRDLMGIDFRTDEEFPADDTGYGFDNIGDVLTTSPLLLEKYMQAAETITAKAVPLVEWVIPQRQIGKDDFRGKGDQFKRGGEIIMPVYEAADVTAEVKITKPGTYRIKLEATVVGSFPYDPGKATVTWSIAGKEILQKTIQWQAGQRLESVTELKWEPGTYPLRMVLEPQQGRDKQPPEIPGEGKPFVDLRLRGATLEGPLEKESAARPPNFARFFPRETIPDQAAERRQYMAETLRRMTTLAFRRPVDEATVERLTGLAEQTAGAPDGSFQKGIARALTAVLASPRFLFRMEDTLPMEEDPKAYPLLDEYALASRLSYFLWSTMPDAELRELAERGTLRQNLPAQVRRLLADERSNQFVSNFAGQWLQTRDVESVSIDARTVLSRDAGSERDLRERFQRRRQLNAAIDEAEKAHDEVKVAELKAEMAKLRNLLGTRRIEFSGDLRSAMRQEAELFFRYLLREDRSVLELVDTRQTFLNEILASHYGVPGVTGGDMRLVDLPPDSPRGGVLTMGTVLAVTSNPTRTSPVKRGLFILDNILGTPPPPPPPDIPSLEASEKPHQDGSDPTLREALEMHRAKPLCASCHQRMDPLGLALENFNAIGLWRDQERGQPLASPAGQLVTGEAFQDVRELKRLLVTDRRMDYYRCLTEKLLTYALGRGPEPCDIQTVDGIVDRLEQSHGKFSTLITGIIDGLHLFPQRGHPQRLVADRAGEGFRLWPHAVTSGGAEAPRAGRLRPGA
ncbi:MAG: DUF1592 domain-containing protein [Verrucomicrobiaceae bacterium]|nr:MAG: DUF1592 domain-containing protein [Verrucomicrobiaceae bacterium]